MACTKENFYLLAGYESVIVFILFRRSSCRVNSWQVCGYYYKSLSSFPL